MKSFTPFRIAGCLAILFCAGHTVGGMLEQSSLGPASDDVFALMKSTHFRFNGADCTWYGFWFGFGLMVSAFLLLVALAAFVLDRAPLLAWPHVAPLAWGLVAAMAFNGVVAWRSFFAGPVLLSAAIVVLLVLGIRQRSRQLRSP